jgi:hypothetical protein
MLQEPHQCPENWVRFKFVTGFQPVQETRVREIRRKERDLYI